MSSGQRSRERVIEAGTALAFLVSMLASIGFAVAYWRGGQTQWEGVTAALAFGGLGLGLGLWGVELLPSDPSGKEAVQERHPLASSPDDRAAFTADFVTGEQELARRTVLGGMAAAAVAAMAGAALFPLRSLGSRPWRALRTTPWQAGMRLITAEGRAVRPADLEVGQVLTVFPDLPGRPPGAAAGDTQTLLIRLDPTQFKPSPERAGWAPDGAIAYSKVCTHAGCPVGLYDAVRHQLVCPCHQSLFNVLDEARPVFGPATRPLPQLPLTVDGEGYLVAQGDYPEPIGPGFWAREGG
ncbi:MAG: Rieske (2Fe-2S) protein [Acidimicrobiales bacterium]